MTKGKVVLPMETYRLARYAVQVPCYVCSGENSIDAELCRHCTAPMALTHQAATQKAAPRMIAAIGSAGAGKTVFLGMLTDMLSRQSPQMQVLARGAFSVTLQQTTMHALGGCNFPEKTPSEPDRWNWVHCQVRMAGLRRPLELMMPDMAGEALLVEIDHPHSFPVIRAFLSKCTGALVMIDAERIAAGDPSQDFFTMKLLSYLSELDTSRRTGWLKRPLGLVFTKADECEPCFENPREFARLRTPGLWQHCSDRFKRHQFFAAGVAGACVSKIDSSGRRSNIPLRVEPRGVIEPFRWLVEQMK